MFLSTFDIFKIGIGPSASHTMGPMIAAKRFVDALCLREDIASVARITVTLHGSLAFTGRGHATDRAVCLGMIGEAPATLDLDAAARRLAILDADGALPPMGGWAIGFDPASDIVFDTGPALPGHSNGMVFKALSANGDIVTEQIFYSIGGGFVMSAEELEVSRKEQAERATDDVPFPFSAANDMLDMGRNAGLFIAAMQRANEVSTGVEDLDRELDRIWREMQASIRRGLETGGVLPGGLKVPRRAPGMYRQLQENRTSNTRQPHAELDWLMAYALAVNEENAAGGRIVTAPTNGAAGVVPAVLQYYVAHCHGARETSIRDYLLTAAAIGGIIKRNASISGAELGCQGEVGSAAAMAAAGLCAVFGGSNAQVENAAEIALEHHLGLTCDPVAGLVQVPCIERNGLGAASAVAACSLALQGNGSHFMPLDNCIAAMRATGLDMSDKYKETSRGGLAVNLPAC